MRPSEREQHHEPGERFVGRERELARLSGALDQLADERGRMFLVSGEPGIGKTRLAVEFSARARARGLSVIWGRSSEVAGAPAYWPIIQVVRACAKRPDFLQLVEALGAGIEQIAALVPEIIRPAPARERAVLGRLDPEQARFRLFDAVATLLRNVAQREAVAIIIDDLHDADLSALQMVLFLARALKDSPVVLLGTYREAEVERLPELQGLFAQLVRESIQLPLRGLSLSDAADLVRDRTGISPDERFLAMLLQTTQGNPLFLGGVVQMLADDGKLEHQEQITSAELKLPSTVQNLIRRSLGVLSDGTNSLLTVASALGIEFELAPLEHIGAAQAAEVLDCLDEAAAAGIVVAVPESRGHWRFAHPLIRAAIYDSQGCKERGELHRRIADALEDLYASNIDSHLPELAHHYIEATPTGAADKAIDYSIRAGEKAREVFAHEETIELWRTAIGLIARHGGSQQRHAKLLGKLGILLHFQNDNRSAIDPLESAVKLYEELSMPFEAASVRQRLGQVLASPGETRDTERAFFHLRTAEAVLGKGPDSISLSTLYFGLGLVSRTRCHVRDALAYMERAASVAERVGSNGIWAASATQVASYLLQTERLSEARTILETVWRRLREIKDVGRYFGAVWAGGGCLSLLWDFVKASEWFQQGLENPMLLEHHHHVMARELAHALLRTGDLVAAERVFGQSEFAPFYREGDWQHSRIRFQQAADFARRSRGPDYILATARALAGVLRMLGEPAAAAALLEGILMDYPTEEPHLLIEMTVRPFLTFDYLEMGAEETARRQVIRCNEILAAGEDWRGLGGHAVHAGAAYLAAEKNYDRADEQFAAAIKSFKRFSLVWDEAEAFRNWGRALFDAGEPRRAIEKFDAAIDIYRRIGAGQPWSDRVVADRKRVSAQEAKPNERAPELDAVFRQEGDFWTISHRERTFRLKDMKGLHYIAYLLAHPGRQFHVHDLIGVVDGSMESPDPKYSSALRVTNDLGDAGAILDARAKAEYRKRAIELRAELGEAESANDIGSIERIREELEMVEDQLASALGLGGRGRKAADHSERSRSRVARAIRGSLSSIRENDATLGYHLSTCIRTGYLCAYHPDPEGRFIWQL
jgi:tetratricopeptide (TPR) repeat protein